MCCKSSGVLKKMDPISRCSSNNTGLIELADDANDASDKSTGSGEKPKEDFWSTIKYGNRAQVTWAIIADFCSGSTIAGLHYFSEQGRHWTERTWWVSAFAMVLFVCGLLTRNAWIAWDQRPMVITFAEKMTPIWSIPFPAVTICSEAKFRAKKLNFTKAYHMIRTGEKNKMSVETPMYMESVMHLCDAHSIKHVDLGQNFSDNSIYKRILNVNPDAKAIEFIWRNSQMKRFHSILTEEGVCFTFNALNSRDIYTNEMAPGMMNLVQNPNVTHWDMENGYNNGDENSIETYPHYALSAGRKAGLHVDLAFDIRNLVPLCRGPVQGFKVLLHNPGEVPQISKHYFRVPADKEVLMAIKPQLITTSENLRSYKPNRRQCFFESDRQLRFFKIYTQRNCELECLANFTKIECGCVKFSMPRDIDTPICGTSKIMCYNAAEGKLMKKHFAEGTRDIADVSGGCDCLPACTSITYDAETTQSKYNWDDEFEALTEQPKTLFNLSEKVVKDSRLFIFFKQRQFIALKQSEYYSTIGFLANCGGLLSLFMGISFMSIIEIIYYSTLRLGYALCIRKMHMRKKVVSILKNIPKITIIKPAEEPSNTTNNDLKRSNAPNITSATGFHQKIKCVFREFLSNSTIHGMRYFSEPSRHWAERIWWMISFALSIYFCANMIQKVWMKWDENPVIVTFADKMTPISEIPFPTVTICPEIKIQFKKLDFKNTYYTLTHNETISKERLTRMKAALQICDMLYFKNMRQNFTDDSVLDTIKDIALPLDSTVSTCKWRNRNCSCNRLYQPVLTDEGLCYTFNALNSRDIYTKKMAPNMMTFEDKTSARQWNLEEGYDDINENKNQFYPYRVNGAGPRTELTTELKLYDRDLDVLCRGSVHGFRILLHSAAEVPQVSTYYFHLPLEQEISVSVKPQIITTSVDLQRYKPHQRHCFFGSERQLRFFKVYTQRNCELECHTNFTKSECGCVKFSMPRDKNTSICGIDEDIIGCLIDAEEKFFEKDFNDDLAKEQTTLTGCNCLPACNSIDYNVEISQNEFSKTNSTQNGMSIESFQPSRLTIFYENHQFMALQRSELYGRTDFLANCGGILGLIFGASLLSIIEIFYYFTLRLGCSLSSRMSQHETYVRNMAVATAEKRAVLSRFHFVLGEISDFLVDSSVHGVRYFTEKGRHRTERIFWAISVGISLVLCVNFIQGVYIKWQSSPVIVTFSEKATSVSSIPFPAVTICPETKSHTNELNFTKVYNMIADGKKDQVPTEQIVRMKAIYQLCDDNFIESFGENFTNKMFPDIGQTHVSHCRWHNDETECESLFQMNLVEDGLCYTFNALNSRQIYTEAVAPDMMTMTNNPSVKHWNIEDGYENVDSEDNTTYPYRMFGSGSNAGLFTLLHLNDNALDFLCRGPIQGSKIFLHHPGEVPQLSLRYFRVPILHDVMIAVKPQMIITAESLRSYSPTERQCYFNGEHQLKYFKMYTQHNCEMECLANYTRKHCGCVKFSMPRDNDTRVCGSDKIQCCNKAEDTFLERHLSGDSNDRDSEACNCLSACVLINYDAEIIQTDFDKADSIIAQKYDASSDDLVGAQPARLSVFFKEHRFVAIQRSELYGYTDFFANCGGLLGLFLGASVLSVIECIYHFTLRLGCSRHLERKRTLKEMVLAAEKNEPSI